MRKNSLRKRAFTLVELVVVIAIVAILVAVLISTFMKVIEKSHESTALSDANNLLKTLIPELMDEENSTDLLVFCAKGGKIYAYGFQHDIRRVLPYKNGPFAQNEEDINGQVNGAIITALTTDGYISVDASVTEDSWRSAANIKQMLEDNNFNTHVIVVRADYLIDDSFFNPADISGGGSDTCTHEWDEGVVVNEANCGVAGSKKFTCSLCGATKTEPIPATGAHTWGEWTTNETTHTRVCSVCNTADSGSHNTEGEGGKCSLCGYNTTCTHEWGEGVVVNEANCGVAGSKKFTCSVCGSTKTEPIPATGAHTWSEWTTNETTHTRACTVCNTADSGDHDTAGAGGKCSVCGYGTSVADPCAEGHTVESWTVIQESTCTEAGYKVGKCTVCGEVRVEEIPAGHNLVYYKTGNPYADKHLAICSVCNTMTTDSNGVRCDTDGEGGTCSKCHSITHNCNADGHIWYDNTSDYVCAICGTWHGTSHDTNGEGGSCSVCGYKAHEHDSTSWTVETAPTCTTAGQEKGTCAQCGITIRRSIPATGHTITSYTGFDMYNHMGECDTCHQAATQSHQYTLVSSADGVYHYQCACGVLMEVSGTDNPNHEHKNITINYNEWGKTNTTVGDKTYSVWICTCTDTPSCGAKITYYVPVS